MKRVCSNCGKDTKGFFVAIGSKDLRNSCKKCYFDEVGIYDSFNPPPPFQHSSEKMDRDKCQLCKSGVINLRLAKKDGQLMCDDCRIMTEFEELKKEMRARLAYYFDTDEHEPITPEIVEEWMWKAINASINKERVWRSLWNIANDAKGGE